MKSSALLLFLVGTRLLAGEISPEMRLKKLSAHLRGIPPAATEYEALKVARGDGRATQFFEEKTKEYLATPQHTGKMMERVEKLLRLRTPTGLAETRFFPITGEPHMVPGGAETLNALDLLTAEMVRTNASWDRLLVTQQYPLYSSGPGTQDISYYQVVAPELMALPKGFHTFSGEKIDSRFAGVLTTSRFFARYSTTNLNKNRGRASAIFRVFLCDDMRAVVEAKAEEEKELLGKAFPPTPGPDGYHNRARLLDDPHGSEESCRACHYKLDPMGRAFLTSGGILAEEPAPGALVYKRADGTLVDIKGRGIGALAAALVAQPEYARCQVTHFWKWFVRADQLPTESRLTELTAEFNRVGRRVNDFIGFLVNQPEFRVNNEVGIPTLTDAKAVLTRCDACHAGLTTTKVPAFTKFPIGGDETEHAHWLSRIANRLDLVGDGKERTMPPPESAWQPAGEEIRLIKAWISGGARDEAGKATLGQEEALSLVGLTAPLSLKTFPKFNGTFRRYLASSDIFRVWHDRFPRVLFQQFEKCQCLQQGNRATVGDPNPFDGELIFQGPSPAFVRWYGKCLTLWILQELNIAHATDMRDFFGAEAVKALESTGLSSVVKETKTVKWSELPSAIQIKIVTHLVHSYIGPGIISDEAGYITRLQAMAATVYRESSVYDAFTKLLFLLGTQEEFLTY